MSSTNSNIKIATRGSLLARWQADHVAALLKGIGADSTFHIVKTTGDKIQDRYLHEVGGKGLFIKELEESLLAGEAHIAVHSMKDLPAKVVSPFEVVATLPRHDARDVLIVAADRDFVGGSNLIKKETLAGFSGKRIATSSLRRQSYLRSANVAIHLLPLRGNVDTRVRKLVEGECDGIILAKAALERLGMHTRSDIRITPFDPEWFVPCVTQGIISIEAVAGSPEGKVAARINDKTTFLQSVLERHILFRLGGDCTLPFGCQALVKNESGALSIAIHTVIVAASGKEARFHARSKLPLRLLDAPSAAMYQGTETLTKEVLAGLLDAGANDVLRELKLEPIVL